MAKCSLYKYLEVLFDIDPQTNDFVLEDNEYIRIVCQKSTYKSVIITHYVKTVEEITDYVNKYKYNFNIYIGIATVKDKKQTQEYMYKRKVLLLDFDRKDYPQYTTVQDFTKHIKARVPDLFLHMVVDTGHGYHFYIAINQLKNNKRITEVNKKLAELVGADVKAALPTQIARLPSSINLKDADATKPVSIITNALESKPEMFRRCNILKIEHILEVNENNKKYWENLKPIKSEEFTKDCAFHCIEAMIAQGVRKGERNFALGRITNYLKQIKGYKKSNALNAAQEWNLRCDPPKSPDIIQQDFERYWNTDYKLLGCNLSDSSQQKIIDRFCDVTLCKTVPVPQNNEKTEKEDERMFDNNLLKNPVIRKNNGYHYMILSVLDFNYFGLTKSELKVKLTSRNTGKCCISDNTLNKYLKELLEKNYIILDPETKKYVKCNMANYNAGFTKYAYSATLLLIEGRIKKQEYLVYLTMKRNLQMNKSVTEDQLSEDLGVDRGFINKCINGLNNAGLIAKTKNHKKNGGYYNVYNIA